MKKTILFIFSVFLSGVVYAQSAPVSPELSAVLPQTALTATGAEQHVSALNASELSDEARRELIREAADKKEWTRAFELILPLALKGDYQAQANLGILYARGQGVPQDFEKAYWWFSEAAEKGSIKAINNLAVFYLQGHGVKQDIRHSITLFEKTANSGSLDAMLVLGQIYENELNQMTQAFKWYKKAAEAGNHDAQFRLAVMYENGEGTKKNKKQAVYWYQKVSVQQNELAALAQERLSRLQ
ncbi:sel1 repeat family protein [Pasteurella multocida]|uniref:tetratricopeptide repeat protein n=1 Tax=Pasteurella multocida TaxID=747 RepID=UPI001397B3E3|nr:tetratricopeptide repeat protein [Pasteurella multocida]QHZ97005.1 sel1 repeat family protein [Pasteurella multocida]